ncbi:unnamed protein product [Pleuronectes platessa]|uniref:Uncharacterized protein n=1 Tax=Pleuronectes platessa TaxID=8262 RepID=A0A9N7UZF1_PLEPL|nr:unnamed protein product [Pleuronectes platessa]
MRPDSDGRETKNSFTLFTSVFCLQNRRNFKDATGSDLMLVRFVFSCQQQDQDQASLGLNRNNLCYFPHEPPNNSVQNKAAFELLPRHQPD